MYGLFVVGWLSTLPQWVLVSAALAGVFTILSASLFLAAELVFDDVGRAEYDAASTSEGRRRVEIREYLDAIGERYAEDHFVEGHHVAFYLPERDVAVTFNAHAYFRIEGSGTSAVLVEHEMHGHHLGARLPFEVPEVEMYDEPDEGDVVQWAFDALGLPPTATADEVQRAYRERVKEAHPDHGGSEDAFKRVREAYATAKDHASESAPRASSSAP